MNATELPTKEISSKMAGNARRLLFTKNKESNQDKTATTRKPSTGVTWLDTQPAESKSSPQKRSAAKWQVMLGAFYSQKIRKATKTRQLQRGSQAQV